MTGEKHYYQGSNTNALLHVEMIANDRMNLKLSGDPVIVCKMIAKAMDQKQDIAATMIAAVVFWAKEKNIFAGDLEAMVKFH